MGEIKARYFGSLAFTAFLLSLIALILNACWFRYSGNVYIYPAQFCAVFMTLFIYAGFFVQCGRNSIFTLYAKELLYFFCVLSLIAFMTTAVQYTPFAAIDTHLLVLEDVSRLRMETLLALTHDMPLFRKTLIFAYSTIDYQLVYLPLILMALKRFHILHEFYFLLLLTALIGFIFYYFFPTMAPASVIDSPYFMESQKATGLKFEQIHHHLKPTTVDGGLIALPSFHVIWAYLCLNLLRGLPIFCWLLFPMNSLLALACVLLGWHYPIDLLGSVVVIIVAHIILTHCYKKTRYHTRSMGGAASAVVQG